jgi:hypothetical protein
MARKNNIFIQRFLALVCLVGLLAMGSCKFDPTDIVINVKVLDKTGAPIDSSLVKFYIDPNGQFNKEGKVAIEPMYKYTNKSGIATYTAEDGLVLDIVAYEFTNGIISDSIKSFVLAPSGETVTKELKFK